MLTCSLTGCWPTALRRVGVILAASGVWAVALGGAAHASVLRYCDRPVDINIAQQDRLFRFSGVIKDALEASGQPVALIARSGMDLDLLGLRYSHAGFSLKASDNGPWSVRQLYYACDERVPRIFDQGMSGFVLGTDSPKVGYVSVVLLPTEASEAVARVALDKPQALRLLHSAYSANAFAFSLDYQNCNQWVVEMLATAFGAPAHRAGAQSWLRQAGYVPSDIHVGPLVALAPLNPWLHNGDHPVSAIENGAYQVSMPVSIETFLQQTVPGAQRMEFCYSDRQIVIHRGWDAVEANCKPGPSDTVLTLGADTGSSP